MLSHHCERVMATAIAEQLAELNALSKDDLRRRWVKLTGRTAPKLSTAMLRLSLGYELQFKAQRGPASKVRQQLAQLEAGRTRSSDVLPGMRLAREHAGKVHIVTIGENGEVLWNEREWKSLSEVARAITGTRWSGPAFFGLREKRKAA